MSGWSELLHWKSISKPTAFSLYSHSIRVLCGMYPSLPTPSPLPPFQQSPTRFSALLSKAVPLPSICFLLYSQSSPQSKGYFSAVLLWYNEMPNQWSEWGSKIYNLELVKGKSSSPGFERRHTHINTHRRSSLWYGRERDIHNTLRLFSKISAVHCREAILLNMSWSSYCRILNCNRKAH